MFVKQPHQFYGESVIYSYLLESVISRFPIIVIDENTYAAIKDYPKTDLLAKKDKNDRYYLNIFAPLQSEFFMEFRDETFTSQKIDMDQVLKNIIQNRKKFKYDANNYEKYGFLIEEYQKYIEMMNIIKVILLAFALPIWWILMRFGDIEGARRVMGRKSKSLTGIWESY